jgi:hypothetical protein
MNAYMTPQQMASQGRYGDSMLVHMAPSEVSGLQALAQSQGTSLTTNPDTGLPEAFKLKQLLPTLLGAGAMMIPGLQGLGAGWIGAGIGGLEALRTGDLGKGLMAGLGAFGGAGLTSALTSMGSQAAASNLMAQEVAEQSAMDALGQQAMQQSFPTGAFDAGLGLDAMSGGVGNVFNPILGSEAGVASINQVAQTGANQFAQQGVFDQLGQGAKAAMAQPGNFGSTLVSQYGGPKGAMAAALPPTLAISEAMTPAVQIPELEDPYAKYKGPQAPTERGVRYPTLEELRSSREFSYFTPSNPIPFKSGGSVPMLEDGGFVLTKKAVDGIGKGDNTRGQRVASMGLGALPIKGKGTGTSDSIKTSIDGKVPARVSNGEAYVPRKKVQQAGGAKKLYALMRKAERRA